MRYDVEYAKAHGLQTLLRQTIDRRKQFMVQCIDPDTMIPQPDEDSATSQPPYPTPAALHHMRSISAGIRILHNPEELVMASTHPREKKFEMATERAVRKLVDKGTMVVITLEAFEALCMLEQLPFLYNENFFVAKTKGDPDDSGRLIVNFSKSFLNCLAAKRLYAERDGSYRDGDAVLISRWVLELSALHPNEPIYLAATDVSDCFKHIPVDPRDIPLTATVFYKEKVPLVALSTGASFGLSASNTTQKIISEGLHAVLSHVDKTDLGRNTSTIYLDDLIGARIYEDILQFFITRNAACDQFEGVNSIAAEKNKFGQVLTLLGYLFNCISKNVSISDILLEKYIWVLFHLIPKNARVGTPIPLKDAQAATNYLHLVAVVAPALHPFSKGLARATHGAEQHGNANVYLSADAMVDITHQREFAKRVFHDCRCLTISMDLLVLRHIRVGETAAEFQHRQRSAADFLVLSDSRGIDESRTWGDGFLVAPGGTSNDDQDKVIVDWGIGLFDPLYEHPAITADKDLNIAILEMLTTLRAVFAFLHGPRKPIRSTNQKPIHLHILTDNHVSYYRLLKSKGTHPIVPHLLRINSLMRQEADAVFTYGTISSVENRFTDAASRGFNTAYGPQAFERSQQCPKNDIMPPWWNGLQEILNSTPHMRSR